MDFCRILGYLAVLVFYSMIGVSGALKASNLAREVICEGCHAVVTVAKILGAICCMTAVTMKGERAFTFMHALKEANSLLSSSKRSSAQVRQAVMNVCQVNRLTKYEFSPPNMVKACDYWRNNYMDEVKDALAEGGDVEDQEIQLCFVETDACHNVDRSHFRINKYPGPSKSKVRAALKSEEDEEEEASEEEEVATENGEMGEEVFEAEVEEEVETVKTKDEVGDTQEDAAQEVDEKEEASVDSEEKEEAEDEDKDESREDETTEKARNKKQDGKKQGKAKKGKDKDKKKDGSKKKDGAKKKGGDKKKDKRKDKEDEKKKQKGKKDKKDKQDKSSKKENKKKENKNKKNSEKNKGKKNKKDEL